MQSTGHTQPADTATTSQIAIPWSAADHTRSINLSPERTHQLQMTVQSSMLCLCQPGNCCPFNDAYPGVAPW